MTDGAYARESANMASPGRPHTYGSGHPRHRERSIGGPCLSRLGRRPRGSGLSLDRNASVERSQRLLRTLDVLVRLVYGLRKVPDHRSRAMEALFGRADHRRLAMRLIVNCSVRLDSNQRPLGPEAVRDSGPVWVSTAFTQPATSPVRPCRPPAGRRDWVPFPKVCPNAAPAESAKPRGGASAPPSRYSARAYRTFAVDSEPIRRPRSRHTGFPRDSIISGRARSRGIA
jgi:hypothetical protein